jgi:hypothetical protein
VLIHCDLIADKDGKSVDGNHIAPWLPAVKSGDGVAGGIFESWFLLSDLRPIDAPVSPDKAVIDEPKSAEPAPVRPPGPRARVPRGEAVARQRKEKRDE